MNSKPGLVVAMTLAVACASFDALSVDPPTATTGPSAIAPAQVPSGPKKRISVAKFDANGAFVAASAPRIE